MLDIAVIEDETRFTKALTGLLDPAKYRVYCATNREDGMAVVRRFKPDVVLLNREILDAHGSTEGTEDAENGKRALKELDEYRQTLRSEVEICIIIVSGASVTAEFEEYCRQHSDGFLVKRVSDPKRYILPNLEPAIRKALRRNEELQIETKQVTLNEEQRELLRRLFWESDKIVVSPLYPGFSGAQVCLVEPSAASGTQEMSVVKLSRNKPKILREISNYLRYVRDAVPLDKYARYDENRGVRFSREYAGFVSNFIGCPFATITDFGEFFRTVRIGKVDRLLLSLEDLGKALAGWQNRKQPVARGPLFPRYEALHLFDISDVTNGFQSSFGDLGGDYKFALPGIKRPLYHPASIYEWLKERSPFRESFDCTGHRDLRTQNVFVDVETGFVWLIDFGLTGPAPLLVDLAKIEASIKFEALRVCDTEDFNALEAALSCQDSLDSECPKPASGEDEILKAVLAIQKIRELAGKAMFPLKSFTEYQYALLFLTLQYFKWALSPKRDVDLWRKRCLLVSSAILADQLNIVPE